SPVIMVSALTQEGADITFRALEAGAVDFIAKPDAAYVNIRDVARDLVAKVRAFGVRRTTKKTNVKSAETPQVKPPAQQRTARAFKCVAIGTSTGGPVALSKILPALPVRFAAPLIIVQHMPLGFTRPLADRLNATSSIEVLEAENGMVLTRGRALIAPAGKHLTLRSSAGSDDVEVVLIEDAAGATHVPSVDRTMASVGEVYGACSLGTILTGMGQDGVAGLRVLKERGGYVIGQDEATCVVYGMPRAAAKAGLVDIVLPLDRIPSALCELTNSSFARS
ncbi:MAG TPA: chemotaxis-specific protein-glutamate methyltransferase CheB, partial [Candidatus Baltobacteraceae bacterium]|nr:chemotaxis-specific protein-glutamate methyltransferase CheB [Candidatus Baltobacteraceae bacterium]